VGHSIGLSWLLAINNSRSKTASKVGAKNAASYELLFMKGGGGLILHNGFSTKVILKELMVPLISVTAVSPCYKPYSFYYGFSVT
jgi:hypothetical protein